MDGSGYSFCDAKGIESHSNVLSLPDGWAYNNYCRDPVWAGMSVQMSRSMASNLTSSRALSQDYRTHQTVGFLWSPDPRVLTPSGVTEVTDLMETDLHRVIYSKQAGVDICAFCPAVRETLCVRSNWMLVPFLLAPKTRVLM